MNFEPPPLEAALLAQGVAPDALYPLDIAAAFNSLEQIRPSITTWTGISADAVPLLVQGELGVANAGN
ncbi:ABC transporter substrate-binding protein, partial [Escherichia marmotae]|nr:ABC transporter substrate-binding protein [Escherichia marmotae]